MNLLLALVVFPLLFFLPGYVTARALFRDPGALASGEKIFIPIALSIFISLWFGLVLAEFRIFSLVALCALVATLSIAVAVIARTPLFPPFTRGDERRLRPDWIFIATLLLGVLLAAHPAESILGNTDAGVYVNLGAHIARTGAISIHDALVQSLPPDSGRQFFWDLINPFMLYKQLRLPGFFIADQASGLVLPQFLHLYPVWLAIFDATLGLRAGLYATPIIGLLGSVSAYFLARTLFNRTVARLAFFLLIINVPQFWFARYPVAEALTQCLLITGMYAFVRSRALTLLTFPLREGGKRGVTEFGFPLVAALAFAEIFFTRADAILLLAPLGLYALVVIFTRSWKREHWVFFGAFSALLVQAFAHMYVFAPTYIYFQYSHFLRMKNIDKLLPGGGLPSAQEFLRHPIYVAMLAGIMLFGVVLLFGLDRLAQIFHRRAGARVAATLPRYENALRWLGAVAVVALIASAYLIAPRVTTLYAYVGGETPLARSANLVKLGWYLSPLGIALAALGAAVVIRRDLNRRNLFFFGTAALFAFFYLEELYSNPHYIYTTRHYIPLVIPLFILLAARALEFLWSARATSRSPLQLRVAPLARVAAGATFALWLIYNLYVMGVIDASRASGIALRLPFVNQTTRLGPMRLEPFSESLVGVNELGGAYDQIESLAEKVDPNAVIIFSNNRDEPALIATPLHFLYDRDAVVARFNQPNGEKVSAMIDQWRAQGRPVILAYGTNGGKLTLPRYSLEPLGDFALDVPQWAFAYQYMPRAPWRVNLNFALYRAVPQQNPSLYPLTINFGEGDESLLVSGFMERPTGASTRWMGAIPEVAGGKASAKKVTATLRLPDAGVSTGAGASLDFTLTARAPKEGMHLTLKSGNKTFGEVVLTREFASYPFTLATRDLKREENTYLLDLVASAITDAEGRLLGAELQSAVVSSQPAVASHQ